MFNWKPIALTAASAWRSSPPLPLDRANQDRGLTAPSIGLALGCSSV